MLPARYDDDDEIKSPLILLSSNVVNPNFLIFFSITVIFYAFIIFLALLCMLSQT